MIGPCRATQDQTQMRPLVLLAMAGLLVLPGLSNPLYAQDNSSPSSAWQMLSPGGLFRPSAVTSAEDSAMLSAEIIAARLHARGYRDIAGLRLIGRTWLCQAIGPKGENVVLVIDAQSGDITGQRVTVR
jgi:hypothetical protein